MPGSCSSGFRSRPSARGRQQALERVRREQHEQQEAGARPGRARRARAPPSPRGSWRDSRLTASVQPLSISIHSSSEPSWPPQTAGDAVDRRQLRVRMLRRRRRPRSRCRRTRASGSAKAKATSTNCVCAAGRASAIQRGVAAVRAERAAARPARARRAARGSARVGRARGSWLLAASAPCAASTACCGLGRHVVLVVLGQHLAWRRTRRRAPSRPCATAPLPSLNRSGRMPVYSTGMSRAVSVMTKRTVMLVALAALPCLTMPPTRKARPLRRLAGLRPASA